ncbi:MAG: hypothetical protein IAF08_02115 [Rhizobacter sp.]|nr:hypothetical protein [Chlorobiales bacterium]
MPKPSAMAQLAALFRFSAETAIKAEARSLALKSVFDDFMSQLSQKQREPFLARFEKEYERHLALLREQKDATVKYKPSDEPLR